MADCTKMIGSPGRRLTVEEREDAVRLRLMGESVSEIARRLRTSRQSVTAALARPEAEAMAVDCRAALRKHRARFVELWVEAAERAAKQGKHLPAMHALLSLREVDQPSPPPVLMHQPMQIAIGVQLPGLPAPAGSTFTLPALPSSTRREGSGTE
jgi:transposase-like protein